MKKILIYTILLLISYTSYSQIGHKVVIKGNGYSTHQVDSIAALKPDSTTTLKINDSTYVGLYWVGGVSYQKGDTIKMNIPIQNINATYPIHALNDSTIELLTDSMPKLTYGAGVDTGTLSGRDLPSADWVLARIASVGSVIDSTAQTGILKGDGSHITAAVSGTDIKTINGSSVLGSGDLSVGGGTTADSTLTATAGQTAFTFSSVPTSTNDYIIFINGSATTDFTVSSDTITVGMTDLLAGDKVRYKRIK